MSGGITVSCAMIVRDCEQTIGRACESVKPHVSELVIMDTGSVDGTPDIARQYASTFIQGTWRDSFSDARQRVMARTRGTWVMHLDSDDVYGESYPLRQLLAEQPKDVTALRCRYLLSRDEAGAVSSQCWVPRVVRRGSHAWFGRAHEALIPVKAGRWLPEERVWVEHKPMPRDESAHLERNVRLLKLDLMEQDEPDPRTLFYLARDTAQLGRLDEAYLLFLRYLDRSEWDDERYIALTMLAWIARTRGHYDEAENRDSEATRSRPYWPDAYYGLMETSYYRKRWRHVVAYSEIARSLPTPVDAIFHFGYLYRYSWRIFTAVALYHCGRIDEAYQVTADALKIRPDDKAHLENLEYFRLALESKRAG